MVYWDIMRVIAGTRRSLPLKTLEGDNTRPTADKYKETLFNCLQMEVPGSLFLDGFSGSGSIGIEALSRGAKRAVLVENNKDAYEIIRQNIHFTKFENEAELVRSDVVSYLRKLGRIDFDILFFDPPYGKGLEREVLEILATKEFLNPDFTIVVESKLDEDFDFLNNTKFKIYKTKNYKTNKHIFICGRD
ncbi:16S rRNA (guanine966-N2)-methyltransferase [Lachnospiraceae bacterium NE2001]|nr:16S rRNA (guanine966-N2)-methyltransferase [Lachnospiraceae bacterium NE2001]